MLDAPRLVLAIGWGALFAAPLLRSAHRVSVTERFHVPRRRSAHGARPTVLVAARESARRAFDASGPVGRVARALVARRRHRAANRALEREAPVGDALARLAGEERAALRRRAEAHARKVPVRLLFPLVFLVLPAFVLLTVVPGLAAGLSRL